MFLGKSSLRIQEIGAADLDLFTPFGVIVFFLFDPVAILPTINRRLKFLSFSAPLKIEQDVIPAPLSQFDQAVIPR